jgi:ADP-ribose pyrophosphatase YjhB (NUDIX family)
MTSPTDAGRSWSLPGGKRETLAGALVREMKEETGLDVEPGRLLYVCDHLPVGVVHDVRGPANRRDSGRHRGRGGHDPHPRR